MKVALELDTAEAGRVLKCMLEIWMFCMILMSFKTEEKSVSLEIGGKTILVSVQELKGKFFEW